MINRHGKEEEVHDYIKFLTSNIVNAKAKIAGWMGNAVKSYLHRHFPQLTPTQINEEVDKFVDSTKPVW
jgi:hypothetical protein